MWYCFLPSSQRWKQPFLFLVCHRSGFLKLYIIFNQIYLLPSYVSSEDIHSITRLRIFLCAKCTNVNEIIGNVGIYRYTSIQWIHKWNINRIKLFKAAFEFELLCDRKVVQESRTFAKVNCWLLQMKWDYFSRSSISISRVVTTRKCLTGESQAMYGKALVQNQISWKRQKGELTSANPIMIMVMTEGPTCNTS